jgi:hypothetical protein
VQLAEYSAGFMTPDAAESSGRPIGGTTHPSELSFGDDVNQMTHELLRLAPSMWRLAHHSNPEQEADRCEPSRARGGVRTRTGLPPVDFESNAFAVRPLEPGRNFAA